MVCLSCMRIAHCFFMFIALVAVVACGSKFHRVGGAQGAGELTYLAMESERERVLPHLHYSLDAGSVDRRRGTVELSFYFAKEQGDSVLWVECVERVPLALIDTALCRRWFAYDYYR